MSITDSITDYFFTTSEFANDNLINLGINKENIFYVGNTMIDTLLKNETNFLKPKFFDEENLVFKKYLVLTMHRPSNVDENHKLKEFLVTIDNNSINFPVIFPVHPRTSKILKNLGLKFQSIIMVSPMPYLEFNFLVKNSKCVITDSGGITEETTVMGIPCMTLRDNTERPETIKINANYLSMLDEKKIINRLNKIFSNKVSWQSHPYGKNVSNKIVKIILNYGK